MFVCVKIANCVMAVTLVQGAQWGDEGKGKIIDYLSKTADYTIRFHGGSNAGHTVVNKYGKFAMHLVPSGIFNKKSYSIISGGVILDLETLSSEIDTLKMAGVNFAGKFLISPRCHIIMPYHKILDKVLDEAKGKAKTATTGRGIGPCFADKVSYNGIRLADLMNKNNEKIEVQIQLKNKILKAFGQKPLDSKEVIKNLYKFFKKIKLYIKEPYPLIEKAIENGQNVLLEGAHGMFLDNDWGTYPFVTASSVVSGGVTSGAGISPKQIDRIIGVVKAYTTRVGNGPMPTELFDKNGERLQKQGLEFGTTTGRKRRCGWLDLEMLKFAAKINGFSEIALTKIDVLDSFDLIKICTHYTLNGKKVSYIDGDANFLNKIKPVYKTMNGWKTTTKGIKKFRDLPKNAKKYIKEIEREIGVKISFISTGEKRNEIIKI